MNADPIFRRVSVRRFLDRPVEEEKIEALTRAAMAAPSAGNQQPWEFFVVTDRAVIGELSGCSEYSHAAAEAPVVIVPCARSEGLRFPELVDVDLAAATENMLLEAVAQGLGAVWMAVSPWGDRIGRVRSALDIPEGLRPFALVPVGYPAEGHPQQDRYDEGRVHRIRSGIRNLDNRRCGCCAEPAGAQAGGGRMRCTRIGRTGIEASKVCVGCMSFGKAGTMHDWTLDEKGTADIVGHALDLGINFFDTANAYSAGTSEEYLGRALRGRVAREDVVIASKVYFNPGRLSAEAIHREIDGTLRRLGTDYLDLYIVHRFDYGTPIEETMGALNDLVESGKVRAIGASAMYGYQFHDMQICARDNGWARFEAMEDHYNLLYREDERELIPICRETGVSLMPYSPLASGHLARDAWEGGSLRARTDRVAMGKYDRMEEQDMAIVHRVHELAEEHGVRMSQIALAWEWAKGVMSPIVGATKAQYLDDAVGALDVSLSSDEIAYLEEPYVPHPVVGAIDRNPPEDVVLLDEKRR